MNELEKVIKDLRLEERSLLFSRVYLETEDYIGISGYETGNVKVEDIRNLQWYQDFVKEMEDTTINAQVMILQLGRGEPEWATEEELDYVIEYRKELEGVYGRKEVEENQYGLYHVQQMEWGEEESELSYEEVQDKIYAELINQERKEEMPDRLYKDIEGTDLTTAFHIKPYDPVEDDLNITEELFKKWGISVEELYQQAIENGEREHRPVIYSLDDMIKGIFHGVEMEQSIEELEVKENQIYVLSAEDSRNGAIALCYPNVLQQLSEKMNGDLLILPSSVHETMVLKDNGMYQSDVLQLMVMKGNRDVVTKENEILSNHIYRYDKKEHCLKMETTKEQEKEVLKMVECLEEEEEKEEWER